MAETRRVFPQSPSVPILEESKRKDSDYLSSSQRRKEAVVFPQEPPYQRRRRRGCLGCCCYLLGWLILVLVCIVVALGIAALVVWLVLRPIHLPNYSVEQVVLSSISAEANSTPPTVSASLDYVVRAHNPNKHIGIHYDSIIVQSDYNGDVRVGVGELPGFYQPHRNVTILRGTVVADRVSVSQSLANSIQSDVSQGRVPLTIVVRVRARVKARSLTLPKIRVRYTCHIHVSPANSSGGARLLDKRCKVRVGL